MTRRIKEEILQRIFDDTDWPEDVHTALQELRSELDVSAPLRHIRPSKSSRSSETRTDGEGEEEREEKEEDLLIWETIMNPIVSQNETWLTAPWLVAEYYFYRRVCEAVAFGKTKYDPFERQKKAGLRDCHEGAKMLILKTQNLITSTPRFSKDQQAGVKHALYLGLLGSLWGNQADLSLWPSEVSPSTVGQPSKTPPRPSPQSVDLESEEYGNSMRKLTEYLLADHFQELWNSLIKEYSPESPTLTKRIDLITDNAGFELISDLCLVSVLLELGLAERITLRVKSHPLFVSDAMVKDVVLHLDEMKKIGGICSAIASDWESYIDNGKLSIQADSFFCQPLFLWDMPHELWNELNRHSDLVIVKGDANYRRLTEDRSWDFDFPFEIVVEAFPTRVVALRTLKSESGVGMDINRIRHAETIDPTWMVDGRWGVLQFSEAQRSL